MSIRNNAVSYRLIPVAILFILGASGAVCQLNSNTASVALRATLGESLTVAATPSAVNIPLVSGGTGTSYVAGGHYNDLGSERHPHRGYAGRLFCQHHRSADRRGRHT